MNSIKIKIKEELETVIEGIWNAQTGTDEIAVIEAVEMFLNSNDYDFDKNEIAVFKADGRAMCDDCQSDGLWVCGTWK